MNLLKKILQVRKSKITAALKWLFEHNVLFKNNFNFDKNSLDLLLEGKIPESLIWTTTTLNLDSQNIEHFTRYTQNSTDNFESNNNSSDKDNKFSESTDNNTIGSSCELKPSGIVHTNDTPISKKELTLLFFRKLMNNVTHKNYNYEPLYPQIILVPHDNTPLNEYSDEFLFLASFPIFYPYGIGGHKGHLSHVSLRQYTNHLMCHRDPKFRQHRSFPFVAFNILQRQVSFETYNLMRNYNFKRSANLIATLKSKDISIAINQEQNK
ncbi:hypothetical protein Glove_19g332 [Diversispora epigaea]|uniref:Uncharacterized protein n=1 Tax=Diversispora epigaea TaxID=1348612 RepID=A0A397JSK3_9GLOM|nr:hypothetical protein Glove_19g332 [Diversispora epigaea]